MVIKKLGTGNISEFDQESDRALVNLGIQRYFSRARTPKDRAKKEGFDENLEH